MDIVIQYPPKIEKWEHASLDKFMGQFTVYDVEYVLGITPQDPREHDCCYFNVTVEKKIEHDTNGQVFFASVFNCFKVRNHNQVPTVEFYFDLIDKATFEFAKLFHDKTRQTNLLHHKIPKAKLSALRADIQKCIDTWDKTIRDMSLN